MSDPLRDEIASLYARIDVETAVRRELVLALSMCLEQIRHDWSCKVSGDNDEGCTCWRARAHAALRKAGARS